MTREPLNIAVIGFGRMGRIYARTIVDRIDGAALYAIADPAVRPDDEAAAALGVPHVLDEATAALDMPEVHAVVVATPTDTHRDIVEAAAQSGKAIFCEKPLALSLDATREVVAAVEQADIPLQVGFMRRFDAAYRRAKQKIEGGQIGQPLTFRAIGRDRRCPDPAFADPTHSGGLIVDMAIHDFDLARWMMGCEVERVHAEGSLLDCEDLQAVGDIDNAVINVRFDDGALGTIEVSRNASYGYDVRTEVLGTDGVVHVGGERPPQQSRPTEANGKGTDDHYLIRRFGEAYRAQIQDFVTCVQERRPPRITGADAQAAFEAALAATYAARTGEPVTVEAVRNGWAPDLTRL